MLKILKGRKAEGLSNFRSVFFEKNPFGVYVDGNTFAIIYVKYFCEGFYQMVDKHYEGSFLEMERCKKVKYDR